MGKSGYRVDAPLVRVQTKEYDGSAGYIFRHDFTRLDSSNFHLLAQHQNDTVQVIMKLAKGAQRSKSRSAGADANLYKALITGGGYRPVSCQVVKDEQLIPDSARDIYQFDEEKKEWVPGWYELPKEQMATFTHEKMSKAIENLLKCRGEYLPGTGIEFMFEKAGVMKIRLDIGDFDEPAYRIAAEFRRPESKRRTRFKEDFAYAVERPGVPGSKDNLGTIEISTDYAQAVSVFDEHFSTIVPGEDFNEVLLTKPHTNGGPPELESYSDARKDDFLSMFNPMYKVEMAATMIQAFVGADRESSVR